MSESYSVYLPNYTVGADCYKEIKNVTARYGKSAVLIGGKTALSKAQDEIIAAAQEAGLKITGIVWYGGNATYENVQMLMDTKEVQDADMVFAVGGGRAVDTCKTMATKMGKPLFAFPTIASNCAACTSPLLEYGKQALEDCHNNRESAAVREVALDIIISTGIVSNMTVADAYYYNSSLAHCFYNAYTVLPQSERHLHGEVVAFGVLVLLTCDGQLEERNRIAAFNKELGLPVTLAEMEVTEADLETILDRAPQINEWKKTPYPMTREKFKEAILAADAYGKTL